MRHVRCIGSTPSHHLVFIHVCVQGPFRGTVTESESEAGDTDTDQVKLGETLHSSVGAENGNHETNPFPVKKVKAMI